MCDQNAYPKREICVNRGWVLIDRYQHRSDLKGASLLLSIARWYCGVMLSSTDRRIPVNPIRTIETQCSHAEFMQSLPKACGNRPYEIIDNQVIVHDKYKKIRIIVHDEPIRHLGSLDLPMEKAEFVFEDYSEEQADAFMHVYRQHSFRGGGL